jgi:hypothetical protein
MYGEHIDGCMHEATYQQLRFLSAKSKLGEVIRAQKICMTMHAAPCFLQIVASSFATISFTHLERYLVVAKSQLKLITCS